MAIQVAWNSLPYKVCVCEVMYLQIYLDFYVQLSMSAAMVNFSQEIYITEESNETLRVSVLRSGDIDSLVVVLVADQPYKGTATGKFASFLTLVV